MKPIIIFNDSLTPSKYIGITIFPFIILRKDLQSNNEKLNKLINHETTHIYQQLGLLIIPFYLLYIINYLINLFIYHNHHDAYRNIVFEREAYDNEINPEFRFYKWIKYV